MDSFSTWLLLELEERGWTQAELARRAKVSPQAISFLIKQERKIGPELASKLAAVFNLPEEEVFRKAGLLPESTQPRTLAEQRLLYRLADLNDAEIDEVLAFIEFIQSRSKRTEHKITTKRKREGAAPPVTLKK